MNTKIAVSSGVAFLAASMLAPPDAMSQLTLGGEAALLCAVVLLVLTRRRFVKTSSSSVHTLVCILVCLVAVLSVACCLLRVKVRGDQQRIQMLWDELDTQRDRADSNGLDTGAERP